MNILQMLTTLVLKIPILGTLIQRYLPTDKSWFQSATAWAGILWAVSAIIAGADIQGIDAQADKLAAMFNVAGPILMLLGVRKAATNSTPPPPAPPTK